MKNINLSGCIYIANRMTNFNKVADIELDTKDGDEDIIESPPKLKAQCGHTSIKLNQETDQESTTSMEKLLKAFKRNLLKLAVISSTAVCITLMGLILSCGKSDTINQELMYDFTRKTLTDLFLPLQTIKVNSTLL